MEQIRLQINRGQVRRAFDAYVRDYDITNEKIQLKVAHTYRVAEISEQIALGLHLSERDTDLAWLIGMLHDIGRFEQLRRYNTFVDADSIDHAHFAIELLFEEGLLQYYLGDTELIPKEELDIIRIAIWNHSAYRIEQGLSERIMQFCRIIRDADKVDIFRVARETPLEVLYDFSAEEVRNSVVSEEVMRQFLEGHAIIRGVKKSPVDFLVGHIALAFELEFPVSYQIVKRQGYLDEMLSFISDNPFTEEQFQVIRGKIQSLFEELSE